MKTGATITCWTMVTARPVIMAPRFFRMREKTAILACALFRKACTPHPALTDESPHPTAAQNRVCSRTPVPARDSDTERLRFDFEQQLEPSIFPAGGT